MKLYKCILNISNKKIKKKKNLINFIIYKLVFLNSYIYKINYLRKDVIELIFSISPYKLIMINQRIFRFGVKKISNIYIKKY